MNAIYWNIQAAKFSMLFFLSYKWQMYLIEQVA